jgi:hypothetical protein
MRSPIRSPNGNTLVRVTLVNDAGRTGLITRVTSWLVNVPIPKVVPDHLTAPLRERARDADDRLERTAHRLLRRRVNRGSTNRNGHIR